MGAAVKGKEDVANLELNVGNPLYSIINRRTNDIRTTHGRGGKEGIEKGSFSITQRV